MGKLLRMEADMLATVDNGSAAGFSLVELLQPTSSLQLQNGTVVMFCDIDARKAEACLARTHPQQRGVRSHHVARIASALKDDRYKWIGSPVRFDREERLIDGQHRLAAVRSSGTTMREVPVMILSDDDALLHIDTEAVARSGTDALRMKSGVDVPVAVFSAVVLEFLDFDHSERNKLSRADQADLVGGCAHLDELAGLRNVARACKFPLPSGVLPAALRCLKVNRDDALVFFTAALRNEQVIDGRAWDALRVLSITILNAKGRGRDAKEIAAKCIRAWNAYRSKQDVKVLKFTGSVPVAL